MNNAWYGYLRSSAIDLVLIQPTGSIGSRSCLVSLLHHVGGPCLTADRLTLAMACAWHFSRRQATHAGGQFWPMLVQILEPKKGKTQPIPFTFGQIQDYIYLYTVCAHKRRTKAHRSTLAQAFTSAQTSERMLGQALHPRWALTAICTTVSLPGLFACVSSAPLLLVMLFRPFSMTRGNLTRALFFFFFWPVLSNECTSEERFLWAFVSTPLRVHLQMWACLFI